LGLNGYLKRNKSIRVAAVTMKGFLFL